MPPLVSQGGLSWLHHSTLRARRTCCPSRRSHNGPALSSSGSATPRGVPGRTSGASRRSRLARPRNWSAEPRRPFARPRRTAACRRLREPRIIGVSAIPWRSSTTCADCSAPGPGGPQPIPAALSRCRTSRAGWGNRLFRCTWPNISRSRATGWLSSIATAKRRQPRYSAMCPTST